ncbi:zinc ribbon domain-containing protein [Alkalicoccobacillus porphyridii]|uniref:Zinc ribbon domain-containing protein n=1 Tax=Alkalicoccobacillus porphyridii TaxID=2597270 RepID=A0A554A482_9BACI|nr:zinc ribbon domain-containing protein [Alkalicoccobacillus porphyridii]TSB48503.1 zinc ribbon domain-containing protein [Alkalicoccobacillus porphyridii]
MYCKQCGTKAHSHAVYCANDGVELRNIKEDGASLTQSGANFCSFCSQGLGNDANYCTSCGRTTEGRETQKKSEQVNVTAEPVNVRQQATIPFIKLILYPIAGMFIVMVVASMMAGRVNSFISYEIFEGFGLERSIELITLSDIVMLFHSIGATLNITSVEELERISLVSQGGFLLLLLIPATILSILGMIVGKEKLPSLKQKAISIFIPAFIYALAAGVISIFASKQLTFMDDWYDEITVASEYGFLNASFHAFVISAVCITIGVAITESLRGSTFLHTFKRAAIYSLICLVAVTVVAGVSNDQLKEDLKDSGISHHLVTTQLGAYYWNISQLSTVKMDADMDYRPYTISHSAFGGTTVSPFDFEVKKEVDEVMDASKFLFILPILIHTFAGYSWIAKQAASPRMRILVFYALSAGFLHAMIIWLTTFSFDVWYTSITVGSNWLIGFLLSSVIAGVSAWGGSLIRKNTHRLSSADSYSKAA